MKTSQPSFHAGIPRRTFLGAAGAGIAACATGLAQRGVAVGQAPRTKGPIVWMDMELIVAEGYNHFEVLETLGNPYGVMGRAALALMKLGQA